MSGPAGLFTIPPGAAFADAMAAGIFAETEGDPLALADHLVLLPTRRACRALRESFLRVASGRPLLLPQMRAIGDVDADDLAAGEAPALDLLDLPPAITEPRRLLLLARLVLQWDMADHDPSRARITPDHAVRLARELARLIDQVQTERLSFDALASLVPQELAIHWADTLKFLRLVTENWPALVAEEGCLDPADRRNRLIEGLAQAWARTPPPGPVVAAGSTGSVPATADLFGVIAGLPQGRVVLPGLDRDMDDESWAAIINDPAHPQHGMARLLERLGVARAAVRDWPHHGYRHVGAAARATLMAEALRPADTTDAWRDLGGLRQQAESALGGNDGPDGDMLARVVCPGDKEEADVVALLLRRSLDTPGKTAALVTSDRRLARRVAASLRRWEIEIDDSAGQPLGETAPGVFLRLVAEMASQRLGPVALLSACKHPLAAAAMDPASLRRCVRLLERRLLRGPKPAAGIAGLRLALEEVRNSGQCPAPEAEEIGELIDRLADALAPLTALFAEASVSFRQMVEAHLAATEALAASDAVPGDQRLWAGDAGEAVAEFIHALHRAADALPSVAPTGYPDMLDALMAGQVVRPRFGRHPRLNIWGPLEARLQSADLIVLGGLNEGGWPADPAPDPWMSRPMRESFGLPLPERRIGLAAHDFAQLVCAREVVLTRAQKTEGTPTVPSRWLLRLETVLAGCGLIDAFRPDARWLGLQQGLIAADEHRPIDPPAPCPPVSARPRRLSVTRIETWIRDPYAIYARDILRLRPLDPLEADPGAAERGTIIHEALDRFLRAYPDALPDDALERLSAIGAEAFGATLARPAVRAFWWPRFERIARWFLAREAERRAMVAATATEISGRLEIGSPAGPFVLTATADRIDRLAGGGLVIIDYKTGAAPSDKQVRAGYAPQLPLEAAIAHRGGFDGIAAGPVEQLAHWRLTGGNPPGEVRAIGGDLSELAAEAHDGLVQLIAAFDAAETPYYVIPNPARIPRFNDYEHLERLGEWPIEDGGAR